MTITTGQQYQANYATGAYTKKQSVRIGTEMNDETFARIVAEEVKNKATPSQREYLEQPQNRDRWRRALIALVSNLQQQIDDIEADEKEDIARYTAMGRSGLALLSETTSSYSERKNKIERFKFYVSSRLDKVMEMSETSDFISRTELFEKAIREHKYLMEQNDMEVTPADEALWATLDGRWEFDDITM
jgi:hypothetical protein